MIVSQSADLVQGSFVDLWLTVVRYLPSILVAVIVFVLGLVFGAILYRIVVQVVKVLRIDDALKAAGLESAAKDAGFNLDIGRFLGTLVKWFVVIVFLVAALDVLGLSRVTVFLQQVVLLYLPQVIVAVLILNLAGNVAKWSVWTFAILAALSQLNVAPEFMQTLFTGLVVALALAFGLSFGLGGKEAAARTIERIRSEIAAHRD